MRYIVLFLVLVSGSSFGQSLTLPELKQLKNKPLMDNIQVPDRQIVYPVTGLNSMKIKQEYNPMTGSTQYLEVELFILDARGKIVYYYTTAYKGIAEQLIDTDYVRYMNIQGHRMKDRP